VVEVQAEVTAETQQTTARSKVSDGPRARKRGKLRGCAVGEGLSLPDITELGGWKSLAFFEYGCDKNQSQHKKEFLNGCHSYRPVVHGQRLLSTMILPLESGNKGRREESQQRKKKESPLLGRGFTPGICKRLLVLVNLCLNVGAQQDVRNMQ
jgi:hypothetical protein